MARLGTVVYIRLEEDDMRSEVQEYRAVTREMEFALGRPPTRDELIAEVALRQEIREREIQERMRAEKDQFVRVQFHGNSHRYCYKLRPDAYGTVDIGDYLCVYSPMTDQQELVRVVELGRGSWDGGTKIAERIHWTIFRGD